MTTDEEMAKELPEPQTGLLKNNSLNSDGFSLPDTNSVNQIQDASKENRTDSFDTPIADDADLIEKEWIVRAKAVVSKYSDDPYNQFKGLSYVKSDYLKKRYNKIVSVKE